MIIGIDLGGTKLWTGLFNDKGQCVQQERTALEGREGEAVGALLCSKIQEIILYAPAPICAIGVAIPGMYDDKNDLAWAPNIAGWEAYPLMARLRACAADIPISIEDDRTCSILGEAWQGQAKPYKNAVFITVGTGIGAGILVDGKVLRGAIGSAGAVGWMAIEQAHQPLYASFGCFEAYSSGDGIIRQAQNLLDQSPQYEGVLRNAESLTTIGILMAAQKNDEVAVRVINHCIAAWGRAVANLVSILNPEVIVFGGGVFGPALSYLEEIKIEMQKWAQPMAGRQVIITGSSLGGLACLYGAAWSALQLSYQTSTSPYA